MRHIPTSVSAAAVLLISAATLLVASPAAAATDPDSGLEYSVSGSNATITGYTGSNPAVDIPATIGTYPVTAIGDYAFNGQELTSVNFPDSVTTIGEGAFYYNDLASVTIPDSVTTIGDEAFYANALTSVAIGNSVTTIGVHAFYMNELTSVTIPDSVTAIGEYAFTDNPLTSVIFAGDAPTVTSAGFSGSLGDGVGLTVYYYSGAADFTTSPWYGYTIRAITAAESELTLTPTGPVTADGTSTITATITVRDSTGTPVTEVPVPVTFTIPAGVTASATTCTTIDGTCAITLTSSTAATYTLGATIGADPTGLSQNITFAAAPDTTIPAGDTDTAGDGALPVTGLDPTIPLILAGVLLALGFALLTPTLTRRTKTLR